MNKKVKVILCYPPQRNYPGYGQDTRWLPLGIASIASYLDTKFKEPLLDGKSVYSEEELTIDITCLDLFKHDIKTSFEIIKTCCDADINIVGFTCLTEQRISVFELCSYLKKYEDEFLNNKIITVVGGAHATIMADQINQNCSQIDYIVKGEGEQAFYNLVNCYLKDLRMENKILECDPIENLDELPFAIEGFKFFSTPFEVEEAPIIVSRGCTDSCTFCSTTKFWKGYRSRSAKNVLEEMILYYHTYNTKYFKFQDDACTADIENLKELCRLIINSNHKWQFELTARADQFDKELIELLAEAGCKKLAIGIESGNKELRKAMNKRLDIDKAKENIKILKENCIEVGLLLIVGYPGETDETIRETVNFIRETKPDITYKQPLMIFPGTMVYSNLVREKWIDDSYWLKDQPQPYYTKEANMNQLNKWCNDINKASRNIKILIVVPARQKEGKFKHHVKSLNNLKVPSYVDLDRLFILHNSPELSKYLDTNKDFIQTLNTTEEYNTSGNTHEWKYYNLNMITNIKNSICQNQQIINSYDYIFWIDSDLILHSSTLESLLNSNKNIVSEIFWTDWVKSGKLDPNAWDIDHYSFFHETLENYRKRGLYECGGTGACILVNTDVYKAGVNYSNIKNVSFWGEDRAFCIRAIVAGFSIWVDTNFPCIHLYRDEDLKQYEKLFEKYKCEVKNEKN